MDGNYSLSDIAAVTDRNNGGMFGGNGDWGAWIILFLLFGMFGRGGYGGFGGGFGGGGEPATRSDIQLQTITSKLDQQTYGLADSTYALNNAITNGFHGVDRGLCDLGAQLAQCCCDNRAAIADLKYTIATEDCNTRNLIQNNTRDLMENQNTNTRAILDFLTQDKIATLTAENQALKFQASQTAQNAFITANQDAQTAELIRRLGRDCPVPAYVVPNPNCCYGNPVGVGFNNGCGCGNYGFAG